MILEPIPLEAKPDWPEAAKRWGAFWRNETPSDRVLMAIRVRRKENPYPKPRDPDDLEAFHTDLDYFLARRLHEVFRVEYLAEAVPGTWNSITGGYLGILLGGKLRPMEDGVIWSRPFIDHWDAVESISVCRDSQWYKVTREQMRLLAEHKDKFLVRIPDFHGVSDALVSIRGGEALALDLIEAPDRVEWACGQVVEAWKDAFDEAHGFISGFQAGSAIWFGMWHPGRMEAIQEDFADLLSPDHYRRHFMRHDQAFCGHLDAAMFHLHNTMSRIQEVTLDMPEINGTQFRLPYDEERRPGRVDDHLDLYRRMHAAGKKTWYHFQDDSDMRGAILNGDPRHLFLVGYAEDADDARRLMDRGCEWTQQRVSELGI